MVRSTLSLALTVFLFVASLHDWNCSSHAKPWDDFEDEDGIEDGRAEY